ncbi:class I SAM-dependent methyltransferase [Sphingomonas sanxanigenens]|uniref:Methyltransferase domain-containing protein n=1 Tax=Sphingomonas sanxanigenens DSM 19645 = NX02 TaxID=1123269 RepID=W0ALY8_9SPHN|nr:class I SAM-dependent methyltransferase [Sphingomonas sanxanigenens]AHE57497.1 hypothetical protein NX02_29680 [Sphingomonas sanxanigenens DSM 19645 = NX02]
MATTVGTHAERMDGVYRVQRHFYDLTRKFYLLGRDACIAGMVPPPGGAILEVGCGTGRNLVLAARRHPGTQLFGVDISSAMLETADRSVARAGLGGRVTLAQGDATAFDAQALFGRAAFDRIFMSYTLSMIPDWQGALDQAARVLAPGGAIHIVDFGQQERLPGWWKRFLFGWVAMYQVTPRAALKDALTRLAEAHGMMMEFKPLLRGYAWSAVLRKPVAGA